MDQKPTDEPDNSAVASAQKADITKTCQYGWSVEKISDILILPVSIVAKRLRQLDWPVIYEKNDASNTGSGSSVGQRVQPTKRTKNARNSDTVTASKRPKATDENRDNESDRIESSIGGSVLNRKEKDIPRNSGVNELNMQSTSIPESSTTSAGLVSTNTSVAKYVAGPAEIAVSINLPGKSVIVDKAKVLSTAIFDALGIENIQNIVKVQVAKAEAGDLNAAKFVVGLIQKGREGSL